MSEMNGVFAINKPSGISSAQFLSKIQHLFTNSINFSAELSKKQGDKVRELQKQGQNVSRRKLRSVLKVKMGHGGTLDPLASGILVVGVGLGTKKLQNYLNGSIKTYETEALFGASTTTGDVEGDLLTRTSTDPITKETVDEIPSKFIGELRQTPPIFAALKMNGIPLYEYARKGIPLPKAIKPREVKIYELEVFDDTLSKEHNYEMKTFSKEFEGVEDNLFNNQTLNDDKLYYSKEYCESKNISIEDCSFPKPLKASDLELTQDFKAPLLHFKAKVGSGTYIRSLISDVGKSCGSSAYMVKLIRNQQAEWELGKNVFEIEDFEKDDRIWGKVLKEVFEKGGDKVVLNELFMKYEKEVKQEDEEKKKILQEIEESKKEVEEEVQNKEETAENKETMENKEEIEQNKEEENDEPSKKKIKLQETELK